MPEMRFIVRWPDDSVTACYSPSPVVRDYLEAGTTYALSDFVARARTALAIASDRVRALYGFPCTLAEAEVRRIDRKAEQWPGPEAVVLVEAFETDEPA